MSLSATATETDAEILQHLDSATLHKLSLTSKHWRKTTEPFLYRDIKIFRQDRLLFLLHTILSRKKLAGNIKSFSLQTDYIVHHTHVFTSEEEAAVESAIRSITSGLPPHVSVYWIERAMEVSVFAVSLCLILCLATNLQEVDLTFAKDQMQYYELFPNFLGIDWRRASHDKCQSPPFQKLHKFSLDAGSTDEWSLALEPTIPIGSSLQYIHLSNLFEEDAVPKYLHPGLGTTLHTLELDNVHCDLDEIYLVWERQCFWHLKRLVIRRLPYRDINVEHTTLPRIETGLSMSMITDDVVKYLPELEELEFSNIRFGQVGGRSLSRWFQLGDHQNLVKLIVDYDLLASDQLTENDLCLLDSTQSLPPGLRSITLTKMERIPLDHLLELHEQYVENPGQATSFTSAMFKVDGIKEFDLGVQMLHEHIKRPPGRYGDILSTGFNCRELMDHTKEMILRLIETLQEEEGIEMHVWRQDHQYPRRILYAPGYQAPLPHWSDVWEQKE